MTKYTVDNAVNKKDVTKNQKSARLNEAKTVIRQRRHDILSFVLDHIDNGKLSVNTDLSRKHVFDLFRLHCPNSDIIRSSVFFKLFYKSLGGFVVTTQHFIRIKVIGMYHFKKDMQWRLGQMIQPESHAEVDERLISLTDDALKEAIAASKYTLQQYYDSGVTDEQLKRVGVSFSNEIPAMFRQRPILARTPRHGPYAKGLSETEMRKAERRETTKLRRKAFAEQRYAKARKLTQKKRENKLVVSALLALSGKPPRKGKDKPVEQPVDEKPVEKQPVEQPRVEKPLEIPVKKHVQLPQEYIFTTHKENGTFGLKIHAVNSTVRIMHSEHPEIFLPSQIVKINDKALMTGTTLLDVQKTMRALNKVTLRLKPVVPGPSILKKRKFQQPTDDYSIAKMKSIKRRDLFDKVLKAFNLYSEDDNVTTFTREDGIAALKTITALKNDLIENFPVTNVLKCKEGIKDGKDAITVLRQLVRFYNRRVVSLRFKIPGTRGRLHGYEYKLAV